MQDMILILALLLSTSHGPFDLVDLAKTRTWQIIGTATETRWVEIHQVEDSRQERLYHLEVLARRKGAPIWQISHIVPHMAITEPALRRSVTCASKARAVYPETFDYAYDKWRQENKTGSAPICERSVAECMNKIKP